MFALIDKCMSYDLSILEELLSKENKMIISNSMNKTIISLFDNQLFNMLYLY